MYSVPAPDSVTTMTFKSFIGPSSANSVARMMKNDMVSLSQFIKRS
jgi:hypothetical protein